MPGKNYVPRDNFNSASTEMLKILVKTSMEGSTPRVKAEEELRKRGVKE